MSTPNPAANWFEGLPSDRLLAEISMWSADLGRLEEDTLRIDPYTDIYHVDVADGHFAPAMLYFPDLMARLRKVGKLLGCIPLRLTARTAATTAGCASIEKG